MEWHEAINTLVALVGAVTGSLALWLERRDLGSRLSVWMEVPDGGRVNALVEFWNRGRQEVHLELGRLFVRHPKGLLSACPLFQSAGDSKRGRLLPGDREKLFAPKAALGEALRKAGLTGTVTLGIEVSDTRGRRFAGNATRVDVDALDPRSDRSMAFSSV